MSIKHRPTILMFAPATWQATVGEVVTKLLPVDVVRLLKEVPGDEMYEDDMMTFLADAFSATDACLSLPMRQELIDAVLAQFRYLRSFHGCRPLSLDSYYRDGLLPLTVERLAQIAHDVLGGSVPMERTLQWASASDLSGRSGRVNFTTDERELVEQCGHYLLSGAEALSCIWHDANGRTRREFLGFPLKTGPGIPTVIECDVPVGWIPTVFRAELGSWLITHYFQLSSATPIPSEDWSRNWGYAIHRSLPPRYFRRHFHPPVIPDPIDRMVPIKNDQLECPWCALSAANVARRESRATKRHPDRMVGRT